jgi:hypothetical protein
MNNEIGSASFTRKIPEDVQAALDRIISRYNLQQGVYKDLTEIAAEMVVEAEQRSAEFMASYRAATDADAMIARTSPRGSCKMNRQCALRDGHGGNCIVTGCA